MKSVSVVTFCDLSIASPMLIILTVILISCLSFQVTTLHRDILMTFHITVLPLILVEPVAQRQQDMDGLLSCE